MAFQNKNFSVIAYANGFTLWHYTADEPVAAITADDYFTPVYTLMNKGDIVIINGNDTTVIKHITEISRECVKLCDLSK